LSLSEVANDLRLLASGPTTGLNEIGASACPAGSSIYAGKSEPGNAECLDMVAGIK